MIVFPGSVGSLLVPLPIWTLFSPLWPGWSCVRSMFDLNKICTPSIRTLQLPTRSNPHTHLCNGEWCVRVCSVHYMNVPVTLCGIVSESIISVVSCTQRLTDIASQWCVSMIHGILSQELCWRRLYVAGRSSTPSFGRSSVPLSVCLSVSASVITVTERRRRRQRRRPVMMWRATQSLPER